MPVGAARRTGENGVRSMAGISFRMNCVMTRAVAGARSIPLRKCPVASRCREGTEAASGRRPRSGRPSGVAGRRPAQESRTVAPASDGSRLVARAWSKAMSSGWTVLSKPTSSMVAPMMARPACSPRVRGTTYISGVRTTMSSGSDGGSATASICPLRGVMPRDGRGGSAVAHAPVQSTNWEARRVVVGVWTST